MIEDREPSAIANASRFARAAGMGEYDAWFTFRVAGAPLAPRSDHSNLS
jgi:hypothetical protein